MIAILLVDDHPVVREGLSAVLEQEADFRVVGAASSAEELFEMLDAAQPDVVLLDLELPGMSGVEALGRLTRASGARVIVFTAYGTDDKIIPAIRAGAKGYLLKGAPAREIVAAVRAVHAGGTHLAPSVAARLMAEITLPRAAGSLSPREVEVIRLVSDGRSNKQIAAELGITERTVKYHVSSVMSKLGADNRAQAVALASQRGLL
jgi:DNA-binding NarL/FixJ family response regulator